MGTSNFYNKNANRVYAVCMPVEEKFSKCKECGEKAFEWEEGYESEETTTCSVCGTEDSIEHDTESVSNDSYEEDVEYFKERLAESEFYTDGGKDDQDRSFYGKSLGYFRKIKTFGDVEVEVRIQAMIRSGYYEGANLDYNNPELFIDGSEMDMDDFENDFKNYNHSDMNAGLLSIQSKHAHKWAEKALEEVTNALEEVYTSISMPLNVVGRFSNGETLYEKAIN